MNSKIEKLSYEELIKALDCCAHTLETNMCRECPAAKYEAGKCGDLVKLQAASMLEALKTENEQLKSDVTVLTDDNTNLQERYLQEKAKVEKLNQKLIDTCKKLQTAKVEAIKEVAKKTRSMITEIYNKYVFDGFNDLESAEIDAVINFSDDVTFGFENLIKEMVGEA